MSGAQICRQLQPHDIILALKQHAARKKLTLRLKSGADAVRIQQKELRLLLDAVVLILALAVLAVYRVNRLRLLLPIANTKAGLVTLQILKAAHRRELFHKGAVDHNFPSHIIDGHTALDHHGLVVQADDA